jgi:hypothetical protein
MKIDDLEKEELTNQNLRLRRELSDAQYRLAQITDAYDFVRSSIRQQIVTAVMELPTWEDPEGWNVVARKDVLDVVLNA